MVSKPSEFKRLENFQVFNTALAFMLSPITCIAHKLNSISHSTSCRAQILLSRSIILFIMRSTSCRALVCLTSDFAQPSVESNIFRKLQKIFYTRPNDGTNIIACFKTLTLQTTSIRMLDVNLNSQLDVILYKIKFQTP